MTECDIKFLKYCGYDDNQIEHIDDIWDYKKEESYEMWKEGFDTATKELQEKKKNCWKQCKYANPKSEIIQAYISEKEKVKKLQEEMKKDLVSELKELISYSTSPSCTKGMELFIKRIENWEFVK